jgi:hypothetical protein
MRLRRPPPPKVTRGLLRRMKWELFTRVVDLPARDLILPWPDVDDPEEGLEAALEVLDAAGFGDEARRWLEDVR